MRKAWLFVLLMASPAFADDTSSNVAVDGQVKTPATYTVGQLQAMPSVTVTATFQGHGPETGNWKGVPLMALITAAGTVEEKGHGAYLQHLIVAQGSDGYGVGIAIGEIEPKFEGKQVIIAYEKDGKPLDSLRLIVPGDAHAGRDVRDLARITVK